MPFLEARLGDNFHSIAPSLVGAEAEALIK
jgi:hypothetical protein